MSNIFLISKVLSKSNKQYIDEIDDYFENEYVEIILYIVEEHISISSIKDDIIKMIKQKELYYSNHNEDVTYNYELDVPANLNNIISFNISHYLKSCFETYDKDSDMLRQLTMDFYRQDVLINNVKCESLTTFLKIISNHNNTNYIIHGQQYDTLTLLSTLVCQSSLYMSFEHLINKNNNWHETIKTNNTSSNKLNYHIISDKQKSVIHFAISNDSIHCSLVHNYTLVDIMKNKTIINIRSETLLNTNDDKCIIIYNTPKSS